MRDWLARLRGALAFWWRTRQRVNPWQPGHSKRERLEALNREMVWRED